MEVRESFDRTATGKLQKFKLREPHWTGATAGELTRASRSMGLLLRLIVPGIELGVVRGQPTANE